MVEHGRRFLRVLEYTSDCALCLGELKHGPMAVNLSPQPHWQAGDASVPATAKATLLISRSVTKDDPAQTFLPHRFLRGLLPEALLNDYVFWQRPDGTVYGQRRPPGEGEGGEEAAGAHAKSVPPPPAAQASSDGSTAAIVPAAATTGAPPSGSADELQISFHGGNGVVRRVPLGSDGKPIAARARTLICTAYANRATPLGRLVATLSRAEDLSHVLAWSAEGARGETTLAVDRVEMPRLRLTFRAESSSRHGPSGARLVSCEHPGLALSMPSCERLEALLRGMPHALVLTSAEGEAFVLLSGLAKPCRLSDRSAPLNTQLLVARSAPGWEAALPGVRHYLYPVS